MKRILIIFIGFLIIGFVVIQFFQPEKNYSKPTGDDFIKQMTDIPESITVNLRSACYDCHSNQTKYPFYAKVAPISWFINKHVVGGKEKLNFSEWGTLSRREKISVLVDICDALTDGSMPLNGYIKLHKEADLSDEQKKIICDWTDKAATVLMKGK